MFTPKPSRIGTNFDFEIERSCVGQADSHLVLNENRNLFLIVSDQDIITSRDPDHVNRVIEVVDKLT